MKKSLKINLSRLTAPLATHFVHTITAHRII